MNFQKKDEKPSKNQIGETDDSAIPIMILLNSQI